jgi:hypothetical protein
VWFLPQSVVSTCRGSYLCNEFNNEFLVKNFQSSSFWHIFEFVTNLAVCFKDNKFSFMWKLEFEKYWAKVNSILNSIYMVNITIFIPIDNICAGSLFFCFKHSLFLRYSYTRNFILIYWLLCQTGFFLSIFTNIIQYESHILPINALSTTTNFVLTLELKRTNSLTIFLC